MAPTISKGDTLIIPGQCAYRDNVRMVGFPALCSRLSDGMDLAEISFTPRIKFPHERSENLKNNVSAPQALFQVPGRQTQRVPHQRPARCPADALAGQCARVEDTM